MDINELDKYLKRIKVKEVPVLSLEALALLQRQHLLNIPFENLDIHNEKIIELNTNKIFQKIVDENRGGFCYELNGLFYDLLKSIEFEVKIISARVFDGNGGYGKEYDHMALIVQLEGKEYITDVGFGAFAFAPLELKLNKVQNDKSGVFIIDKYEADYFRISKIINGKSIPEYIFKNVERKYSEFKEMCVYHQTSAESHFTQKRLISIPTASGRITISGNRLKIKDKKGVKEKIISEEEFDFLLKAYFNFKK